MYPVYEIGRDQADQIINIEEGFLNDVKGKEIKPAKLSETVSAFANAGGGDVYVGISEIGDNKFREWNGFEDIESANDAIQTLFQAHPFGNHLLFEYFSCSGLYGYVLHITIKKVKEIVRSSKGDVFVRLNAGKAKISTDEQLKQLELDKGIVTFEDE